MAAATGEYWIPAGCKVVISIHIGLVMSLESSSIPTGAWQCWAWDGSVWPSIGEYCIGWLLRQRNYWKLIWAVKAIICRLRNNWQAGGNQAVVEPGVRAISAWSSNLQLQQTVFLLNKMQLDGSFIPSQSSELIENGFSVSLMNVFGSIRYWAFYIYIFYPKKQNHLHVFLLLDDLLDYRTVCLCPFCQIISLDHSKDSIEQKFPSI